MAKFCGKCGSPLDKNGLCPKCDVYNSNETKENKINKKENSRQQNIPLNAGKAEESVETTQEQNKDEKKVEKKHRKKEKRSSMTFGQKAKRFLVKFIAVLLALAILAGSVSCALVYFNIADIPFIEKVMGWFGYEKEQPEETHFANLTGKFTDEKITNSDEAIKAAQNAASQLGLQTATDELSLLKEDTVGELTYYRLQQNYQGIPVYGKTIVVVVDKNGEAKGITSNAIEVNSIQTFPKVSADGLEKIIGSKLNIKDSNLEDEEGLEEPNDSVLLTIFEKEKGNCLLAYIVSIGVKEIIVNAETGEIELSKSIIVPDSVECYNGDGSKNFNGYYLVSTKKYQAYDSARNIYFYTLLGNDSMVSTNDAELMKSTDVYFGNSDEEKTKEYDKGVEFIESINQVFDYYHQVFNDNAYAKLYAYFNDGYDNGNNGLGGGKWISRSKGKGFGIVSIGSGYDYSSCLDLFGHEYTHVVTRSHVDWASIDDQTKYGDEPGAINEGYSDIFGEIIEGFYNNNQEPDWKHGKRVISDPMSQGYPAKIGDKKYKLYDVEGIEEKQYKMQTTGKSLTDYSHGFSTIVSHAAYLMHTGVNGGATLDMSQLSKLWYNTMLILPSDCSFSLLRQYMEITAENLNYTVEQKECVSLAFETVGIKSNNTDAQKYDVSSEVEVFDKNGLSYDDYTIVIDGQEFTGLFKWGWAKKDYHKEISVDSTDPYELNLPKGEYTITIVDNFSGNKTYSKSIKARENQDLKNIEFATAFGFDYSVTANPELQVKDVNSTLYDNYSAAIKGKNDGGKAYSKTVTVDKAEAQSLDLETGKYSFLLTDNADKNKTKSFSVRVRADAPTSVIQVKTAFGKPYGEFNKSDLPSGVKEFNGNYYYIYNIPEVTTWEQAQEYCRSKNGYLATLTTKEENDFAYSLLSSFKVTGAYFGLHDTGYNDWKWVNNEAFSYSNWAYGEPSSYSEPYGMFYEKYVKTWNDGDFGNYTSKDRAFICEWGAYETNSEQISETPTQRTTSDERDVVLCLDMSGSMAGDKLQQTKEASIKFINTVLQEDASIAIVTYDGSARVLSDFSVNAEDLIAKVNEISDGGSTNIEDGLVKSYNLLNYSNAKKQIIVLMSDGEPNSGKVGEDLISYADSIKKEGVYIYTLGFFGGYSGQSAAQTLMEKIASEGCHYEVSDADSLVFFFGDIADTINGQQYIYIRIACPVDVKVSHNDETLNSNEENLSTRTSFGSLTFEENTSKDSEDDVDDRVKILRLKADDDYNISIEGTGRGRMNYTIGFMDENGEYSDFRKFTNIKIKKSTVIDTVAAKSKNTILNVDEDGDGKYDLKYKAGANERGEIVDYSYIIYIVIAAVGLVVVIIAFLVVKKKINVRKRGV